MRVAVRAAAFGEPLVVRTLELALAGYLSPSEANHVTDASRRSIRAALELARRPVATNSYDPAYVIAPLRVTVMRSWERTVLPGLVWTPSRT